MDEATACTSMPLHYCTSDLNSWPQFHFLLPSYSIRLRQFHPTDGPTSKSYDFDNTVQHFLGVLYSTVGGAQNSAAYRFIESMGSDAIRDTIFTFVGESISPSGLRSFLLWFREKQFLLYLR
jgi:hypothetical protein